MPDLHSLVGEEITALVPFFDKVKLQLFILRGIEDGGIWVESQRFTNQFLSQIGYTSAPRTLVFFLPWPQIVTILGSHDVPSLSEKGFGV